MELEKIFTFTQNINTIILAPKGGIHKAQDR